MEAQQNLIGLVALLAGALIHLISKTLTRPTKADRKAWWRKAGRQHISSTIVLVIVYSVLWVAGYGASTFLAFVGSKAEGPAIIMLMVIGHSAQGFGKHLLSFMGTHGGKLLNSISGKSRK